MTPPDKKVKPPFLCRSTEESSLKITLRLPPAWRVRCIAGTPNKHLKHLSRPFSGEWRGSYQKSDGIRSFPDGYDRFATICTRSVHARRGSGGLARLGLELVSRNLTLVQQKAGAGPMLPISRRCMCPARAVRTGCVRGLDCVSCASDGLCVCSLVTLVVLCVSR